MNNLSLLTVGKNVTQVKTMYNQMADIFIYFSWNSPNCPFMETTELLTRDKPQWIRISGRLVKYCSITVLMNLHEMKEFHPHACRLFFRREKRAKYRINLEKKKWHSGIMWVIAVFSFYYCCIVVSQQLWGPLFVWPYMKSFDCTSTNLLALLKQCQRVPKSFTYFLHCTALLFRLAGAHLKTAIKGA